MGRRGAASCSGRPAGRASVQISHLCVLREVGGAPAGSRVRRPGDRRSRRRACETRARSPRATGFVPHRPRRRIFRGGSRTRRGREAAPRETPSHRRPGASKDADRIAGNGRAQPGALRRARRGTEGAGQGLLLASSRGAPAMMVLYIVVAVAVAALALNAMSRRRTDDLRQSGLYPPPGQGSDADVERLVALGRKIDAIKLYREIHGSDLKTAKDVVDRMAAKPG